MWFFELLPLPAPPKIIRFRIRIPLTLSKRFRTPGKYNKNLLFEFFKDFVYSVRNCFNNNNGVPVQHSCARVKLKT